MLRYATEKRSTIEKDVCRELARVIAIGKLGGVGASIAARQLDEISFRTRSPTMDLALLCHRLRGVDHRFGGAQGVARSN